MSDVSVSIGYLRGFKTDGVEGLRATGEALLSNGRVLSTFRPEDGLTWNVDTYQSGTIVTLRLVNRNSGSVNVEQLRPLVAERGYADLSLAQLRIQIGRASWRERA